MRAPIAWHSGLAAAAREPRCVADHEAATASVVKGDAARAPKEQLIMKPQTKIIAALAIAVLSTLPFAGRAAARQQNADQAPATAQPQPPLPPPEYIRAGEPEAKRLLLLMDTDQNGKVSKAEFMAYMEAEFDRLDVNHDGALDVKELTAPKARSVAGGHK